MSRVFRRPMFRGGSTNMNGIMSGIQDRQNYAEGKAAKAYREFIQESPRAGIDPVAKLLISGGLRGLSETRGGSALANTALAFQEPTERLFSDLENRDTSERAAMEKALAFDLENERSTDKRLQALADIKDKQAHEEKLAIIKNQSKNIYNSQLYETQVEKMRDNLVNAAGDRIISKFKGSRADDISRKTTDFVMQAPEDIKYNLIEIDYEDVGKKGETRFVPNLDNVQPGQIFYDATMGQWKKRVSVGQGRLDFVTLDPSDGYKPIDVDQ